MNIKNLLIYGSIILILVIMVVLKKTNQSLPTAATAPSINPYYTNENIEPEEQNDTEVDNNEDFAEKENSNSPKRPYEKKVLNPDIKGAIKEMLKDPEFRKEAQTSMYPKIVEAVSNSVESEKEAENILGMLQGCVSAETTMQAIEIQANCIMGAKELAKKFPKLKNKMNKLILQSASQKAKDLANKLSTQ